MQVTEKACLDLAKQGRHIVKEIEAKSSQILNDD
jgi:hypothetical protein